METENRIKKSDDLESKKFKFGEDNHPHMVDHVFLPRKLPNDLTNKRLEDTECALLALMCDVISEFDQNISIEVALLFERLYSLHVPQMTSTELSEQMSQLEPKQMMGIYVRKANCAVFLCRMLATKSEDNKDEITLATFQANLSNEQIYGDEEGVCHDIQVDYPTRAVSVQITDFIKSLVFAEQICHLNVISSNRTESDKDDSQSLIDADVPCAKDVTQWLIGAASNSAAHVDKGFPIISKKMRDEPGPGFRRSGFWITMKAFLQLGLTITMGAVEGRYMYKMIMLRFMSAMCGYLSEYADANLRIDSAIEMIAKTARRTDKLAKLATGFSESAKKLFEDVETDAKENIAKIRQILDTHHQQMQSFEDAKCQLSTQRRMRFDADVVHKLSPEFIEYLEQMRNANYHTQMGNARAARNSGDHEASFNSEVQPEIEEFARPNNDHDMLELLNYVENWALNHLNRNDNPVPKAKYLRELFANYLGKALNFYRNDPLGYSKMVLTSLKIIQTIDMKVCKKHELYLTHRSGINTGMFDNLLLTSRHHLEVLFDLQTYFEKRNADATGPGLIEEDEITENSFAVRFAANDEVMIHHRKRIQRLDKNKMDQKIEEVKAARESVATMRAQIAELVCTCSADDPKTVCADCDTRKKVQKQIDDTKIDVYKVSMMPDRNKKNAIVFELRIPDMIACLRDVLYLFVTKHYDGSVGEREKCNGWIEHKRLKSFSAGCSEYVFLGTSSKFFNTPRSRASDRKTKHPDCAMEEFINKDTSDYDCLLFGRLPTKNPKKLPTLTKMPTKTAKQTIKKFVTFTLDKSSGYAKLQWALESTAHTQNDVFAVQSDCPIDLTIAEYKAFGSLRADGHHLQYRNLLLAIVEENLSFETPSVLALIMQTLWEAGPNRSPAPTWYRESNADFVEPNFVREMVNLLEAYIRRQHQNWQNPLKLMFATVIICRTFEMNSDPMLAARIAQVLLRFRHIAMAWIPMIQKTLHENRSNESIRNQLTANLVEVGICGALTFYINPQHEHFDRVFGNTAERSAVYVWMFLIATINHNNTLCKNNNQQNDFRETLMRIVHTIGLNIESKMAVLIDSNPLEVYRFVRAHYPEVGNGKMNGLGRSPDCRHTIAANVMINNEKVHVNFDYIFGDFLINGAPMGRLPEAITKHALFQRLFGTTTFEVQPTNGGLCTATSFNGFKYIFREQGGDGLAIIERDERRSDAIRTKELIPHTKLNGLVPFLLVDKFSHWFNLERNFIEFRPKMFGEADFATNAGIQYVLFLDPEPRRLMHVKTKRLLLDVRSDGFRKISSLLGRLEQKDFINVLMDGPHTARIELYRMNLNFIIDCTEVQSGYMIQSIEYSDMRISLQQNIGTLFGLRLGLLLESMNGTGQSKLLIVPHGKPSVHRREHHVKIIMCANETELRTPAFFSYQVNTECRILKANSFAGWFYLAHLHAITSYPLPDPFTGMTGVERALQILQSGVSWSSAPYDTESFNTLLMLADLSPIRQFRSTSTDDRNHQQTTKWPLLIRQHAAHDAFVLIVRKLIADSMRLAALYPPIEKRPALKSDTLIGLNERSYARHAPYAPNCAILETFQKYEIPVKHHIPEDKDTNLSFVRELAANYNGDGEERYYVPSVNVGDFIFELLRAEKTLIGSTSPDKPNPITSVKGFCASSSFANLWIRLYDAIQRQALTPEHFHLIFTLLASDGVDVRHLHILQAIAANPAAFEQCESPAHESYEDVTAVDVNPDAIKTLIDSVAISPNKYAETEKQKYATATVPLTTKFLQEKFKVSIGIYKENLIKELQQKWPCERIDVESLESKSVYVNEEHAVEGINRLLAAWNKNRELWVFTQQIGSIFENILSGSELFDEQPEWSLSDVEAITLPKYAIDFEGKMCHNYLTSADEIAVAKQIFIGNENSELSLSYYWDRFRKISIPDTEAYLVDAELYPRLVPTTVFPRLLRSTKQPKKKEQTGDVWSDALQEDQQFLIGALAKMTCREQRTKRIARFQNQPHMESALRREQENALHHNWQPHQHPDWLLFQIEMDLSIRTVQVDIAERMIQPPTGEHKHSVMQLNMGEGKTSVIVPIVAAELANGKQLCTVTVLRHLFQTNLRSLRQSVGGMLQRRVYTMPCRRDMDIESVAKEIHKIYRECKRERGILMTLPEYRLSFQLKLYDSARKDNFEVAETLLNIHNWLNTNSRHVLDESDALLQPNYQLIFTVGEQLAPDGGALRWTCIQGVLKRVPFHMKRLYDKFGPKKIEFNLDYVCDGVNYGSGEVSNRPEVFRPCRLLDETMYDELKKELVEDFFSGRLPIQFPEVTRQLRDMTYAVLTDKMLTADKLNRCLDQFEECQRQTILILCGILKFDVLKLALTNKRWRVNYGPNMNSNRKMAVPYKAKDVAADMTEFGHPDVAICLTQLSYYYSGLSDAEVRTTVELLESSENPHEIYKEWIACVPPHFVHASIKKYAGVNLSDAKHCSKYLFPILRRNMYVIDHWLSHKVFPREAKLFSKKLMCTAWDLCSEDLTHPVTGFSGTNDTKRLLPLPVIQNDLPALEATNENVREMLLRKENDRYHNLPSNVSGTAILVELAARKIPVLIDAGALMLELNNEQVAREWLKLVDADAAIYFSEKDIMLTIDRKGFVIEFEYSVYRERLHRCVVYLDDVHTRGTDLKFPRDMRACVTLSGGITRDKTVQACMRMRMLGEGHQISFWASHEADIGIRTLSGKLDGARITSTDVFNYISKNSAKFEEAGMCYWSNASINYTKKCAAHKRLEDQLHTPDAPTMRTLLNELWENCSEPQNLGLIELYGAKKTATLTKVARFAITRLENDYENDTEIFKWIRDEIRLAVDDKLKAHASGVIRFTQFLEEENEKELEYELEQNREVYPPPPQTPAQPKFNSSLATFFGPTDERWEAFEHLKKKKVIEPLPFMLKKSQLFSMVEPELSAWDDNLWVTRDFRSVVQLNANTNDDEYWRPMSWIVRVHADAENKPDIFVLISPFECNQLISAFRSSTQPKATLHMFSAKLSQTQSNLINNKALQIPSNLAGPNVPMNTLVQHSMFAGSMYFENAEEEKTYCNFMGIVPHPRTAEEQKAFEMIKQPINNGYIPQRYRTYFPDLICNFMQNPDTLTIGIIERRHGSSRKRSHVGQLFGELKRCKWNDDVEMDTS